MKPTNANSYGSDDDSIMTADSTTKARYTRRSQRIRLNIPIQVECFLRKQNFYVVLDTVTVVINADGALVRLPWELPLDQELQLRIMATRETRNAKVTYIEPVEYGEFNVGVEFTDPNPNFWGVSFPPEDWSPSHPDAKEKL